MSNECKAVPVNCRQRLAAEGKPYPRSSCAACGQLSPNWRECDSMLSRPVPQPPALGDEVGIGIGSDEVIEELKMMADMADNNEDPDDHMMYMRWLAAIRSANAQVATLRAEIDAYKASRERLHQWLREEQLKNIHLAEERDQLKARCDEQAKAIARLISVARTVNRNAASETRVPSDDEPQYRQRKEWIEYLLETCAEAEAVSKPAGSEKV